MKPHSFTLYEDINKLVKAKANSVLEYKPEKGESKVIKVYYKDNKYSAIIIGKDNQMIKTRKTPLKSKVLDLIKDKLDKGSHEGSKNIKENILDLKKYPHFDPSCFNEMKKIKKGRDLRDILFCTSFYIDAVDLDYLRSFPNIEMYAEYYYNFEEKAFSSIDTKHKDYGYRRRDMNSVSGRKLFLPNSIEDKKLYLYIYSKLKNRLSLPQFISSYKNSKKPKNIINPKIAMQNLIDIILKYQNVGKQDENYKLLIVSIIFLYHTAESYSLKGLDINIDTFKTLDLLVKKLYKKGLPFDSVLGTNIEKRIGTDVTSTLDKYNKKNKEELVYNKAKLINELNYFIEKMNSAIIKKIEESRKTLQENIFDDGRGISAKIIKEIKDMKLLKNIDGYQDISLGTYPKQILVCNTYIELYIKNTREINKDKDMLSKIKIFFTKNVGFSTSKKDKRHNYNYVIKQLERKKVIIKRMMSLLYKVEHKIDKTSQMQGKLLSEIAKTTLNYKANKDLKEIVLFYNEKIIKPQLANNVIIYKNILDMIQKYKKYCKVLEVELEKQSLLIKKTSY